MRLVVGTVMLAWLSLVLLGCQGSSQPPASVHGVVRYQGEAVGSARLAFIPDESRGNHGDVVRTETAGDGTFVLRMADATGVPPGWYRITVMALAAPEPGQAFAIPRSLLPDRYRDPEASELSCEIRAGQDNEVKLDLQ